MVTEKNHFLHVVIDENLNTKDEHLSIIEHFPENIVYHDNCYCVKLLFKEIKKTIPENFILAKYRLQYLTRKASGFKSL